MAYLRLAAASAAVLLACGAALAQGAKLTDPQIAHIAYTAGLIDIQAAEQALQKSKNKDVIAFAQNMERDHKAVNDQALALVKKLKCHAARQRHQQGIDQAGRRQARRTRSLR
jgi:putative membrane protein